MQEKKQDQTPRWVANLETMKESGLTQKAYCAKEGISQSAMSAWKNRYKKMNAKPIEKFVEIPMGKPRAQGHNETDGSIELTIGPYRVMVKKESDLALLEEVLKVVREAVCL